MQLTLYMLYLCICIWLGSHSAAHFGAAFAFSTTFRTKEFANSSAHEPCLSVTINSALSVSSIFYEPIAQSCFNKLPKCFFWSICHQHGTAACLLQQSAETNRVHQVLQST